MLGYHQPIKDDFHDWDVAAAPALILSRANQALALTAGKDGNLHGVLLTIMRL